MPFWNGKLDRVRLYDAANKTVYHPLSLAPMSSAMHRCVLRPFCAEAFHGIVDSVPRIVEGFPSVLEGIPRRVPLKEVPAAAVRQAESLPQGLTPDRVGWPVLIFGAVALAIIAEVVVKLKDTTKGVARGSQSERREMQATRRQDNAFPTGGARDQGPEAAYRRQVVYVDRFEERNRGLLWLAAVTAAILGIAGWFNPNSSQPFLF